MKIQLTLEQAYARASEGLRQKMEYSVNLLQKAERLALAYDRRGGYFLAFSGGKDSQALLHIAQLAGVQYTGHMNLTSVDPPEVIRFVKQNYPEVELTKPKASIYHIAVEKNLLPTQRVRWCCNEYKENAGAGKVTLIGIRHQESTRRSKRKEVEISSYKFSGTLEGFEQYREEKLSKPHRGRQPKGVNITNATGERTIGCISGKESLLISPIIHWTASDVWEFLNKVCQVPHCCLYDEGYSRIGCICCPMSSPRQKIKEMKRWPHVKRGWIKAIMEIRRGGGNLSMDRTLPDASAIGNGSITTAENYPMQTLGIEQMELPEAIYSQRNGLGGYIQHPDHRWWLGGFSDSSSSVGLTEEQEREIAENIFDWWISGKSYKKWYAEKFLQLKLEFKD